MEVETKIAVKNLAKMDELRASLVSQNKKLQAQLDLLCAEVEKCVVHNDNSAN